MTPSPSGTLLLTATTVAPAKVPPFTVLALHGDLDLVTAPRLRATLEALARAHPRILLDLQAVTFCDGRALSVFAAAHSSCVERGGWLALACPSVLLQRMMTVTGLADHVPVYPSLASAVRLQPFRRQLPPGTGDRPS